MRWRYTVLILIIVTAGYGAAYPALAHGNLIRSDPPANAVLPTPPDEIRLWFSEPLETAFSRLLILDQNGDSLPGIHTSVDPVDPTQLFAAVDSLNEGIYTITWRVVSAADGHHTEGSFSITVGTAQNAGQLASSLTAETIPISNTAIRWLNLLSLAIMLGSVGFYLFVWQPSRIETSATVLSRLQIAVWIGWLALGAAGVGILFMQLTAISGLALAEALSGTALPAVLTQTRFGHLWLIRMVLWLAIAVALIFVKPIAQRCWIILLLTTANTLAHSIFSHASAAPDSTAAISADWVHVLASSFWIGGLIGFLLMIGPARRSSKNPTETVSQLVGHFSNFARVTVACLIVTGLYSAWLHVGSIEGLLTTDYGRALLIKLILILPLLGIAAINLVLTHRYLKAGHVVWIRKLRGFLGAEIVLTTAILAMVGVMTSIAPARSVLAVRASIPPPPEPQPVVETQTSNNFFGEDLTVQLEISPGWAGENTFTLTITGEDARLISDVSNIQLRFDNSTQNVGTSQIDPQPTVEGIYTAVGTNLSVPGQWRIRATIQRPNEYDTVVDFAPEVGLPVPPLPAPLIDHAPPPLSRIIALALTGLGGVGIAGYFLNQSRPPLRTGASLLGLVLMFSGIIFMGSAIHLYAATEKESQQLTAVFTGEIPPRLATRPGMNLPYIVTANGQLLEPDTAGKWQIADLPADVKDVLYESTGHLWAATDAGLFVYTYGDWQLISDQPGWELESTHGYLFSMGPSSAVRLTESQQINLASLRTLNIPLADQPVTELVMLGTHTHVLHNGGALFHSLDVGLSWEPLNAPEPIEYAYTDVDGNLIAAGATGIYRWNAGQWSVYLPLPGGKPVNRMVIFREQLYALAGGQLYRQIEARWHPVDLSDNVNTDLAAIVVQYPDALWLLDAARARLLTSADGERWSVIPIILRN